MTEDQIPTGLHAWRLYRQAVELWNAGYERAAVVMARSALEWHLHTVCEVFGLAGPQCRCVNLVYATCRLRRAGVITRRTNKGLSRLAAIGGRAAHGMPVSLEAEAFMIRATEVILHWQPTAPTADAPVEAIEKGGVA